MIKIEKLTKQYVNNGSNEHYGVFDIDLEFPDKGLYIIEGKSGCGKTTLLNILGCIDGYDSGSYKIQDHEVKELSLETVETIRSNDFSFIFQDYRLFEELSISENITFNCHDQEKMSRTYIRSLIGKLGLGCSVKKLCKDLSGGEKQRVAIARALLKNPKVIFADEPTGNLDSKTSVDVMNILKEESKNRLIIIVSHDHELSTQFADEIIKMEDGHIVKVEKIKKTSKKKADTNEINVKAEKISLVRSFKSITKVLGRNVKSNVIFTILETFLMIFCLVTVSMFSFNENKVLFQSLNSSYENTCTQISYENKVNKHYYSYDTGAFMAIGEKELNAYPVISCTTTTPVIRQICNMSLSDVENCNFTMSLGRTPTNNSEILVSDFVYSKIKNATFDGTTSIDLNGKNYYIVGTYTTNYVGMLSYDSDYKNYSYKQIYGQVFSKDLNAEITDTTIITSLDFLKNINEVVNTDKVEIKKSSDSLNILYGNLPSASNEVLISKDYFDSLNTNFEDLVNSTFSYDFNSFANVSYNNLYSPYLNTDTVKVVGVVDNAGDGLISYFDSNSFESMFKTYDTYFVQKANLRINIDSANIIQNIKSNNFVISSFFAEKVADFATMINVFRFVALIASIILLVIIFLLLFKDFKNLFFNCREEMGIMMTLGIHQKEITMFTALHYGIFEFISLVISSAIVGGSIAFLNNKMIDSSYMFHLLSYPYIAVIIGFICIIGVAILLAFLGFRKLKGNQVSLWMKNSL